MPHGIVTKNEFYFLEGGGEMGALTRAFDWGKTSVGSPGKWPQSLKTVVSILLSSQFPMFLWWGPDLIQFYNDAYRPSLGNNGKHPMALGQRGVDCWPEIWHIIHPLICKVIETGEATWSEDQLIPIIRNGKLDDVYWTFSYTPVKGEDETVAGVFVVCNETTQKVKHLHQIEAANQQFRNMVMQAPVAIAVFRGENFIAETVNDAYLPLVGKTRDEFAGKPLFDTLPETREVLEPLARELVRTGVTFPATEFEIVINKYGQSETCYFNSVWEPVRDNDGNIDGFMVVAHEMTEQVKSRKKLEESEERFRTMAEGTDVLIAVGDDTSNATYFNSAWTDLTGRKMTDLLEFGWVDLVHPEDREEYVQLYLDAFKDKKTFTGEFRIMDRTGNWRWLLAQGSPCFRPDSSFAGYISSSIDITGRKLAEQETRKLTTILETSTEFISLADKDTKCLYVNPAGLKKLGWATAEGRYLIDCVYPEDRPFAMQILPQLPEKGTFQHEIRFWNEKTGVPFWLQWNGIAIRDPKTNDVINLATVSPDITERKEAENKLKESEQRFRTLISESTIAIAVFAGPDFVVELANESIMELWDKGRSVIGKPLAEVLPELVGQPFLKLMQQAYETGEFISGEGLPAYITRNGKTEKYYRDFNYKPLRDGNGNISSILAMSVDVTEKVVAREKLKQSEQNLRNTILKAPVAMCIFRGPTYIVEIANDRMLELWGKEAPEVINKPIFEGLPEVRDQGFEQILYNVYHSGETYSAQNIPVTLPRPGGIEVVYVNFTYDAYRTPDGTIIGIIAVATDVTYQFLAHRRIEEVVNERTRELAAANNNLQRSNAELEQFAYIASHDLQEPIRKVSSFTQLLEQAITLPDEKSRNYLDKIKNATSRMSTLIRDVLAYSQLSRENEIFSDISLRRLIEDIKTDFELLIDQKGATVIAENLPDIKGIPLQMSQLFSNLISNALKFTQAGVPPVITITATTTTGAQWQGSHLQPDTAYHKIEVRDNGIGFDKAYTEQIFNIFQRLHGKNEYAGTGIGLAMCKKIVMNHHGDIYASGTPGQGAVFTIALPVQPES